MSPFSLIGGKSSENFDDERTFQHSDNLKLSCFVFFILLNSLNCDFGPTALDPSTVDLPECSTTYLLIDDDVFELHYLQGVQQLFFPRLLTIVNAKLLDIIDLDRVFCWVDFVC